MRAHPVIGYEMLKGLHFLESSLSGIRHHHEHWDGTGYPDGLSGKASTGRPDPHGRRRARRADLGPAPTEVP